MRQFIIEIEEEPFVQPPMDIDEEEKHLYRAKGFKSLVFDEYELSLLTPYDPDTKCDLCIDEANKDISNAYDKGKRDGYRDGIDYAWDLARTLMDLTADPVRSREIIGDAAPKYALMKYSPDEVRKKMFEEYEQKNAEIQVGDEVMYEDDKTVCVGSTSMAYYLRFPDSSVIDIQKMNNPEIKGLVKTGRHFSQVKNALKQLQE